jgi:hypothetical protein
MTNEPSSQASGKVQQLTGFIAEGEGLTVSV